jgi:hypothetical protein
MKQRGIYILIILFFTAAAGKAQTDSSRVFEIYGFAQMDFGYNFNQVNPEYYDAMRPSRLPAYENQFGTDGNTYFSVRQSRFGVKSSMPTNSGNLKRFLTLICMVLGLMPEKLQSGFDMPMASLAILAQDKPKVHSWI